jgi:hypothetical protein
MASQDAFDPHMFLAHIGAGRTIATYRPHSPIFAQGDVADAVFYIQHGQTTSRFPTHIWGVKPAVPNRRNYADLKT